MQIAGMTDVGMSRENNQDTFSYGFISDTVGYAIVCDGMGGENGGDIASNMAKDIIVSRLQQGFHPEMDQNQIRNLLLTAISAANIEINLKAAENPTLVGMGTTVVAVILTNDYAYISHVGDSRAYLYRDKQLSQITTDHSIVQELISQGKLSEDDAAEYPHKNLLTRAVGAHKSVNVDYLEIEIEENDQLLLCTDGLSNFCSEDVISQHLEAETPELSCKLLINAACESGGFDNITAIVIKQS